MMTRKQYRGRAREEPFRTLIDEHRSFDIAEMLRIAEVFGREFNKKRCVFILGDKITIFTKRKDTIEFDKITSLNKITECLNEIKIVVRDVISISASGPDYISGLDELLRTKYERNLNNFAVLTTSDDTIDLSVRANGVKGVLRWAFEKYFIFKLITRFKDLFQIVNKICLEQLRKSHYYLPNLVFGHQGHQSSHRSSINFWVEDGKVRYAISPPPKVSKIFLEHGVPVKCHEAVLRYYLAVAVTMLNPLDCYMGEPAVPIVRRRSCGESTRVIMHSRNFDYECGKSYGEELINRLTCKLAEELARK